MASRRLLRDLVISKRSFYHQLLISQQVSTSTTRLRWIPANGYPGSRQFGVFNSVFNEFSKQIKGEADSMSLKGYLGSRQFSVFKEFSKQIKGEADRNQEFRQSVKEFKEKAEGLKGAKEDLKVRTKQTTEQLYKHMDGVWTEAEATAKKVSANVKEKISTTAEEVKETFGIGKQGSSNSARTSSKFGAGVKDESKTSFGEDKQQQSVPNDSADTVFSKFKSTVSSVSPKISLAFQKLKDAKPADFVKKGYKIVNEELSGNLSRRKRIDYSASSSTSSPKVERSTRTDVVVLPSKQSRWSKKWESLKEQMQSHPIFKRFSGLSEPVVTKSQEIAEDIREIWDTSDHPVVHKIQDLNESVFGETHAALSFKEIRRRDPSFSLPEFVAEVQEVVEPVLNAYLKGDAEVLKKYCCNGLIERCKAEQKGYEHQGIFFDKKILHISDVDVSETKMLGDTPIIIVAFHTQQVYCVRDRHGSIAEGGKDTIHNVQYRWAMKQIDVEEAGEGAGALYPIWRLMDVEQNVYQALI